MEIKEMSFHCSSKLSWLLQCWQCWITWIKFPHKWILHLLDNAITLEHFNYIKSPTYELLLPCILIFSYYILHKNYYSHTIKSVFRFTLFFALYYFQHRCASIWDFFFHLSVGEDFSQFWSENVFISSSLLKATFTGHRVLEWQ